MSSSLYPHLLNSTDPDYSELFLEEIYHFKSINFVQTKQKKKRVPLEVLNLYAPAILVSTLHSFNPLEKSLIHTWNIFKSIPEVSDCGSSDDFIGPTID